MYLNKKDFSHFFHHSPNKLATFLIYKKLFLFFRISKLYNRADINYIFLFLMKKSFTLFSSLLKNADFLAFIIIILFLAKYIAVDENY